MGPRLGRRDYSSDSPALARCLLGCVLVRALSDGTRLSGRIVETEAYCAPEDRASHAYNMHRSTRNESMYAAGGTAYVYFTYGMHHCMNAVCKDPGEPRAVLIRALEPIDGLDLMLRSRSGPRRRSPVRDRDLCSGPAKLCQALQIDRSLDGADMTLGDTLWIERGEPIDDARVRVTPRIGIDSAGEAWAGKPLRWVVFDSPHVSVRKGL